MADILDVLLHCPGKNQDVVQVQNNEHVQHVSQDVVHHYLEDGWGIGETKQHNKILIVPSGSLEWVVSVSEIQLREHRGSKDEFEVGTHEGGEGRCSAW